MRLLVGTRPHRADIRTTVLRKLNAAGTPVWSSCTTPEGFGFQASARQATVHFFLEVEEMFISGDVVTETRLSIVKIDAAGNALWTKTFGSERDS